MNDDGTEAIKLVGRRTIQFYKEDERWEIDVTSMLLKLNIELGKLIVDKGYDENKFVISLLEIHSKNDLVQSVWD